MNQLIFCMFIYYGTIAIYHMKTVIRSDYISFYSSPNKRCYLKTISQEKMADRTYFVRIVQCHSVVSQILMCYGCRHTKQTIKIAIIFRRNYISSSQSITHIGQECISPT